MTGFVHLRLHTEYSLVDSVVRIPELVAAVAASGMPAVAITDQNNLFAMVKFYREAMTQGVKPIIGVDLLVAERGERAVPTRIAFLCLDETGYLNLNRLVSRAYLEGQQRGVPQIDRAWLSAASLEGLVALSCGAEGDVGRALTAGRAPEAARHLAAWRELLGDRFYLEVTRVGREGEEPLVAATAALAVAEGVALVATNDVRFLAAEDFEAHEARVCIHDGAQLADASRQRRYTPQQYLRTPAEMAELFADLPEAIANSVQIARRCSLPLKLGESRLPAFPVPDGRSAEDFLRAEASSGLTTRFLRLSAGIDRAAYQVRLGTELEVICNMGFAGYFLIVADFIRWARANGVPVGPGRGSGAGSLVAYSLGITDIDPLQYDLLFERFLNPERVSMPDFDIDFCETRRGEVIRYVQQKYGSDHVAQIITFGKLKARAVLRDCGRILQMSYGQVDRLCKMVPNHPTDPWPLPRALNGAADFRREYENDNEVKRLVDLAMQLEGLPRNSSTHAAGVVIGDRPLAKLVPLYRDPRSDMPVTQFDMKYVESSGLVKFDFLGLKTLSVLRKAVDLLEQRGIAIDLGTLPLDDAQVYHLMQAGNTVGVFQLESEGMRRTLKAVKPTNFGDIIALVSLYRPGPMDNIPLFGQRKAGQVAIEYPHPKLEGILAETYGIFVYQEQVMQAAQVLAGYSLGDADLLRRAMGKKVQAEMDAQRGRFVEGCKAVSDIEAKRANELFDLIDKFAGYGFNKSHAAAYALLAYQTAWMKAHYPEEFYAASMCFDMHQSEKLNVFVDDARRYPNGQGGVAVLPPDINASEAEFTVEQTDTGYAVRYALAGIRNVGEKAMEAIVAERQAGGPFASLKDLFERLPQGTMNRRQLEGLICAGAFDGLEPDRALLFANADMLMAVADAAIRERSSGQVGLFGGEGGPAEELRLQPCAPWSRPERMAKERENFGFYFSAHPVQQYRDVASANGARTYQSLMEAGAPPGGRGTAVMAALVEGITKARTRKGGTFVRADFSDASGQFSAACFEESLVPDFERWAQGGECLLLTVELDAPNPDEPPRLTVRGARPLAAVSGTTAMELSCEVANVPALHELQIELEAARAERRTGAGEVLVSLVLADGDRVKLRLGRDFVLTGELAERLGAVEGITRVALAPARKRGNLRLVA